MARGYAAPHGPHPCGGCGALWTGTRACHCACACCHATFSSVSLFDAHRVAEGEHSACRDPATLPQVVWRDSMWRSPEMTGEEKAAAFGGRNRSRRVTSP